MMMIKVAKTPPDDDENHYTPHVSTTDTPGTKRTSSWEREAPGDVVVAGRDKAGQEVDG